MHSRIYQIQTTPIEVDEYITECDFDEHWFTHQIADYVDSVVDRNEDLARLQKKLNCTARFITPDSFVFIPGGPEEYFRAAYECFRAAHAKMSEFWLPEFVSDQGVSQTLHTMRESFCDEYDIYVSSDEFDTIPLDDFVRCMKKDVTYYVGGTLDYHY